MRLTSKNKRLDRSGKHNDRNFDLRNAPHIDATKTSENKYFTYNGDYYSTFEELEKQYYTDNFLSHIENQNKRNNAAGHPERNKTLDQYYRHDYTRPEDRILQIGDKDKHASADVLWECALQYAARFNDIFGDYCKILDMALHVDEATPHVHIRRVWMAEDKEGYLCVSQRKALEKIGYVQSNEHKYNNGKKDFTATDRQLFYNICKEQGLDVEIDNPKKRMDLSLSEYKEAKDEIARMKIEIKQLEEQKEELVKETEILEDSMDALIQQMLNVIRNNAYIADKHYKEIEEAEKAERQEQYRIISGIFEKEIKSLYSQAVASQFIKETGMQAKYDEYRKRKAALKEESVR